MHICFYRYSLLNRGGDRMVVDYANYLAVDVHIGLPKKEILYVS
jgi:hypothetical protein